MIQFIKFGMVGLCNSVINYIIYVVCIKVGMHYVVANILGFIVAIFLAYLLQSRFVFAENVNDIHQVWWKVLIKTYASYAFTGLILTNLLSFIWLDIFDLTKILEPLYYASQSYIAWGNEYMFAKYIVPYINMIIIIPVNFFVNKCWTYKLR